MDEDVKFGSAEYECSVVAGGLELLLAAVHADDPKREILVRVGDLMRDVKKAASALERLVGERRNEQETMAELRYEAGMYRSLYEVAAARAIAAAGQAAKAVEVIEDIARQHTTEEMDEDRVDTADFEGAYDIIIGLARKALAPPVAGQPIGGGE